MKRVAAVLLLAGVAWAQPAAVTPQDRAAYQTAYREWQTADPDLDRDTPTAGATLGARADKVAAAAARFYTARKAYLDGLQADADQKAASLEALPAPPALEGNPSGYAASQSTRLSASIETIANDPDRAIQRLRLALERERAALAVLSAALEDAQRGREAVERASAAAEQARGKATQHYRTLSAGLQQTALETAQTGALWGNYYRTLSDGARGVFTRDVAPLSAAAPGIAAGRAPNVAGGNGTAGDSSSGPPPALRTRSITPLPLSHYVGAWVYPTFGQQFHGPEPDMVEMDLRENNGLGKGSLWVKFKLSANNPADPIVRFDFAGPFQSTRNQSFPLTTGDGSKGTVELIPGGAFNLLQVRFSIAAKPGDTPATIRQADFLLIKK